LGLQIKARRRIAAALRKIDFSSRPPVGDDFARIGIHLLRLPRLPPGECKPNEADGDRREGDVWKIREIA
jgi:hypothetical protein